MKQSVDLIPREKKQSMAIRLEAKAALTMCCIAALGIAGVAIALGLNERRQSGQLTDLRQQVGQLRPVRDQVAPMTESLSAALIRRESVQRLMEEPAWAVLISDMCGAVNEGIWVASMALDQPLVDTGASEVAPSMLISGTANDERALLQFMTRLSASPRLDSVVLQQSFQRNAEHETPGVSFVLAGELTVAGKEQ